MKLCYAFILLCINITYVGAQENKKDKDSTYFKASISFLTNSVYQGRKDSTAIPYLTPTLAYYNKGGWYIDASVSFNTGKDGGIDNTTLEAGYDFDLIENLSGGVLASKYFFSHSSTAVRSEATGNISANLQYSPDILTLAASFDVTLGNKTDYSSTASLAHTFTVNINDSSDFSIEPEILMSFGTQNNYGVYNQKTSSKKKSGSTLLASNAGKFKVLDYEFSVPLTYTAKKWGAFITPTFVIPVNGLTYPQNNVIVQNALAKLSNSFYAEIGCYIKF